MSAPSGRGDPGFRAAVGAEWSKLRTARAPRRNLVLGTVLGIGLSVLLAAVVSATFDDWSATERADFDPVLFPLSGSLFTAIFFAAVGVNVVMSEYTSGMMRLTLTATPRRGRVLAAKALVVAVATWIFGVIATAGMILASQAVFSSGDLPTAGFGDGDLWRTLLMLALLGPLFPVLAVALAVMLRSTAAALSTVLALIFAPGVLGGLLPSWWQENVLSLLPGPASDSVAIGHLDESAMYLHPAGASVVVAAWLIGLLALAHLALSRRDA